jgi:replication-associated recombination protein RarA
VPSLLATSPKVLASLYGCGTANKSLKQTGDLSVIGLLRNAPTKLVKGELGTVMNTQILT